MKDKFLDLPVVHKIWAIVLVGIIGMGVALIFATDTLKHNLLQDRMAKTQDLVESAHSVIAHYYALSQSGNLSEADAKVAATAALKAMRYGRNGYFWINDQTPRVIMHPIKPKIIGMDMTNVADGNGKHYWRAFVEVVRRQGGGFVEYLFLHNGKGVIAPKVSYVKGFAPWGWIVGTGIYVDDVDAIFYQQLMRQLLVVAVTVLGMLLVGYSLGRTITGPVKCLSRVLRSVQDDGQLTERSGLRHRDEVGQTGAALDQMLEDVGAFVGESQVVSEQLFAKADRLSAVATKTSASMESQWQETRQAATAMTQMVGSASEVAQSAAAAATLTSEANDKANKGGDQLRVTTASMQTMSDQMQDVSALISRLEGETGQIGKVLDVIRGIAEQTNLLALNAAIEAARAGEKGRGFSVVADEVRTLAQRTQESTTEIDEMIANLQGASAELVVAMNQGLETNALGLTHASATDAALQDIVHAIAEIQDRNAQMATAAEEQSTVSAQMNQHIVAINASIESLASTTSEMNDVSQETHEAAAQMQQLTRKYRVGS